MRHRIDQSSQQAGARRALLKSSPHADATRACADLCSRRARTQAAAADHVLPVRAPVARAARRVRQASLVVLLVVAAAHRRRLGLAAVPALRRRHLERRRMPHDALCHVQPDVPMGACTQLSAWHHRSARAACATALAVLMQGTAAISCRPRSSEADP
eukprot:3860629-Pleurochrysis_carterae.AAC.2